MTKYPPNLNKSVEIRKTIYHPKKSKKKYTGSKAPKLRIRCKYLTLQIRCLKEFHLEIHLENHTSESI